MLEPIRELPPLPDANEGAPPDMPPEPDRLHDQVALLANAIEVQFDHAGALLAMAVESIDTIVSSLQTVTSAFTDGAGAGAVDDLIAAAGGLCGITGQLGERQRVLATVPPVCRRLRAHVTKVQKILQVLRIYGINVKVAAAGAEEFVDFVDRISVRLVEGADTAARFHGYVDVLDEAIMLLGESDQALEMACQRVIPQVPDQLIADAEALRTHQGDLARLASSTRQIADQVQREVAAALCAIQVGDRARQRLEHIEQALDLLDRHERAQAGASGAAAPDAGSAPHCDPAVMNQVRQVTLALMQAQLEGTMQEFRRDSEALSGAMRQLRPNTESLLAVLGSEADNGARAANGGSDEAGFLRRLEAGIAQAVEMASKVEQGDFQAEATLFVIMGVVSDVAARTGEIQALRKQVQHMAINTGLRARAATGTGPAVKVVANQILLEAEALDTIAGELAGIDGEFAVITGQMEQAARQHGMDAGDILTRSLAAIGASAEQAETCMKRARETSDNVHVVLGQAGEVLASCREIGDRMEQLAGEVATLRDTVPRCAPPSPEARDHPLWALLDQLAKSYTMAEERRIHASFVAPHLVSDVGRQDEASEPSAPQGHEQPATSDSAGDDDLDDVFF